MSPTWIRSDKIITSYPTRANGIIVLVNSQTGFCRRFLFRPLERAEVENFARLNSSTIDELGSWCLRRAGGAGQQFWQREGGIHRNPASGHRPGTVTLIESVEYLPAPNTYPREGGVGKKSSAKCRQANRKNNNDLKRSASKQAKRTRCPC